MERSHDLPFDRLGDIHRARHPSVEANGVVVLTSYVFIHMYLLTRGASGRDRSSFCRGCVPGYRPDRFRGLRLLKR